MTDWYKLETAQALESLRADALSGLREEDASQRLAEYGPNELVEGASRTPLRILWEQFTATMVLILLGAGLLSALLGEYKDALSIGAIVLLFGLLGFFQEYRAEKAIAALKRMSVPLVRVLRGGAVQEVSARLLVPGDILWVEAGSIVPADVRWLEVNQLRIQEAALTGESEAVEKTSPVLEGGDLPLGDRTNMGYMGTLVTAGRGKGLVVQTGMGSELGHIASMLQKVGEESTPLQRRLDSLGKLLAVAGVAIGGLILLLGLQRGETLREMLLTAVSVAVAIIPEGLPAVVTITLALGAQRMLKRNALIRKLPAVETLGSVTVICSDKTGTLTENRMTVVVLDVAGHRLDLEEVMRRGMPVLEPGDPLPLGLGDTPRSISFLLAAGALCNDAVVRPGTHPGSLKTIGDPTEAALLVAAAIQGIDKEELSVSLPRRAELPFDSDRKRMTTVHDLSSLAAREMVQRLSLESAAGYLSVTKGAVDGLLEVSDRVWVDGSIQPLSGEWRSRIEQANTRLAARGVRVLGVAFRLLDSLPSKKQQASLEEDLVFIGLFGLIDPPRPEVRLAVETCKAAGIRPVMITGDHPLTAAEIGRQLGFVSTAPPLTGQDLGRMEDEALRQAVQQVSVFARVSPEHKLRIVQALQSQGHIVAMTGDGVNDAPALRRADIGVAMGITGTDVAKEAADMVLQDDNFATIVNAVEEGRTIYDNLLKFVRYSLAGNIGKVLVMLLAPLLAMPLPLAPLQLLWLNLLTDGLLGLGFGVEPPEKNIMRRAPYHPQQPIINRRSGVSISLVGLAIGLAALALGYAAFRQDPAGSWQTLIFSTLAFSQLWQALSARSSRQPFFRLSSASNPLGTVLALLVLSLQLAVIYVPFLQSFFGTQPLSFLEILFSLAASSLVLVVMELVKWYERRQENLRSAGNG
jgi:Ca2+-transporting ATPase